MTHEQKQYHFDSFGHGMRDAIVYFRRDLTAEEVQAIREILSPLLRQKHPSTTAQFWLAEHDFQKALKILKVQTGQELDRNIRRPGA